MEVTDNEILRARLEMQSARISELERQNSSYLNQIGQFWMLENTIKNILVSDASDTDILNYLTNIFIK